MIVIGISARQVSYRRLGAIGTGVLPPVSCTQNLRFGECAGRDRRSRGSGLDGLYDGGHGADQLAESLDWPGFAGDVDAGV